MQVTRDSQQITVRAFLKRQALLQRAMTSIAQKGFIADALLATGYPATGGLVPYTRSESIYLDRDPEVIDELGEYPIAPFAPLQLLEERAKKYGLKTVISEEAVKRSVLPEIPRALTKLANTIIRYVDGLFLNKLVNDPDINTRAAASAWNSASTTIFQDIENARSDIRLQFEGYVPDTLVLHPSKIPGLTTNATISQAYAYTQAPRAPIFTGQLPPLFGLDIMYTPNLPSANIALLMQRKMIGGIADETPLEVKALPFNEDNDSYWIKGRRVTATFLQEPKAITKITGI